MARPIDALYVATNGHYFNLPDVDPWDESRDAMKYTGTNPVVAHPPCTRWCRLAGFVEKQFGYPKHQDGGTFLHALTVVRLNGGVLEHPAYSDAWQFYGLKEPPKKGGWIKADEYGGYTCHVEQVWYGHKARKATWLYACKADLPELKWGKGPDPVASVGGCTKNADGTFTRRKRGGLTQKEAISTPIPFRDLLIEIARSVRS